MFEVVVVDVVVVVVVIVDNAGVVVDTDVFYGVWDTWLRFVCWSVA